MIKFTELNKKLKRDSEYIDNVMFGSYKGNECTCLLTFKSIPVESYYAYHFFEIINNYLVAFDAVISCTCSTSKNIVLKFKVKLS